MSGGSNIPFFARVRVQLLLLLLLIFVPALVLTIRSSLKQQQIEEDKVREATVALARLCAAKHQTFAEKAEQLLITISQVEFLTTSTNLQIAQGHFINVCKLMPEYADFALVETNGQVFAAASMPAGTSITNSPCFQRVLSTKRFAIGDLKTMDARNYRTLGIGYPVVDANGKISRILYGRLNLDALRKVTGDIALPVDTTLTIYDREGAVVAHFPAADKNPEETHGNAFVTLQEKQQEVFEQPDARGVNKLFALATVRDSTAPALLISVAVPTETSFAAANRVLWRNIALMCFVFLAALAAAYFLSEHFFLRPLNALINATRRLAANEWQAKDQALVTTSSEFGELARTFNEMAKTLEQRRREIENSHAQIREFNAYLEKHVDERTAELAAANRELERFSYSVSHDLRSPLRAMQSFASILKEDFSSQLPPEALDYLNRIDRAATRLDCLTSDILNYSRVATVQLPLEPVDLNAVVKEVLCMYPNFSTADVKVEKLPFVMGQPSYLTQCFSNLIANGLKFVAPDRKPQVKIWAETKDKFVRIWVEDNGIGIHPEHRTRIFEMFERLHAKHGTEGTGIGLAIVRAAVERMSGQIGFDSEPGKGSRFWIELAAVEAQA